MSISKHNFAGENIGAVDIDASFLDEASVNKQLIKDYIVAIRANKRQWSACTKGRSEVSHSNKKPYKQKGTGQARQGSLASPQYRGGGIVFGPKPKFNQHVRINKKERRLAIKSILSQKIKSGSVFIMADDAFNALSAPKTKSALEMLRSCNIPLRSILFIDQKNRCENIDSFVKSIRNLKAFQGYVLAVNLNGYNMLVAHNLVFSESAFKELCDQLSCGE